MAKGKMENWLRNNWRHYSAWVYLIIVFFDFLVAPILMGWYSLHTHSTLQQWVPLTTSGGGIFHITFGIILGFAVHGRTQEILQNGRTGTYTSPTQTVQTVQRTRKTTVVQTTDEDDEYDVSNHRKN